jgi:hypothetical protein
VSKERKCRINEETYHNFAKDFTCAKLQLTSDSILSPLSAQVFISEPLLFRQAPWNHPRSEHSDGSVWVEHDSHSGTQGVGWEVSSELSSNGTLVTVDGNDLTPAGSELCIVDSVVGLVDIHGSLAKVPLGASTVVDVLDVEQNLVRSLSGLSSSEANESSFLVESNWLGSVI